MISDDGEVRFAAVDDNTNTVLIWTFEHAPADHDGDSDRDAHGDEFDGREC